jgi:hypothetical protein
MHEGFHVGIFFEIPKQLKQEKTDRVIGKPQGLISMGNNGSDEREVYKGGDKSGKPAYDTPIGMDFDVTSLVGILR